MDGSGWQRPYGWERRTEVVISGKNSGAGANQIYMTRSYSPELPPIPTRGCQVASKPWSFTDREMMRKKRIARYKVYSVEGKVKASIKAGLRWIKNKCSRIAHGY